MSNFDDLFLNRNEEEQQDAAFDKEAWAAKKKAERESVYALIDETALGVAKDSGMYRQYLDVLSRFPQLTVSSTKASS